MDVHESSPAPADEPLRIEHLTIEPSLGTRLAESRRRLLRLRDMPSGGAWVADFLSALDLAIDALRRQPRRARAAEAAWMAVHRVREALCLHDDRAALIQIAHEVESDLADHAAGMGTRQAEASRLAVELVRGKGEPSALQRNELYSLAVVAAAQRESDWHRANHLVQRRFRAALAVVALLGVLIAALPFAFGRLCTGQGAAAAAYSWAREASCIVAVVACGALGGLLSVLLGREQLQVSSVEHHVLVATYRLRPVVGAASAVVFFILWESGLLQLADAGRRPAGSVSGTLLLLAVIAGFSERLLLGQIEKLSAALQRATARSGPDGSDERAADAAPRDLGPKDLGPKDAAPPSQSPAPKGAESPPAAP